MNAGQADKGIDAGQSDQSEPTARAQRRLRSWVRRIRPTGRRTQLSERRGPSALVALIAAGAVALLGSISPGPLMAGAPPRAAGPTDGPALPLHLGPFDDRSLEPFLDPEQLEAVPVGPEDVAEPIEMVLNSSPIVDELGQSGIPGVAVKAYQQAAARLATGDPSCGLRWTLLAAIGRVESNHGRFGGAQLREDGYGTKRIRGIPLDGRPNVAVIRDTDDGALDGDRVYDRAVGPMQFIPSTWRSVAVDGNGDELTDPNNTFDAALGAGVYLCAGDTDLRELDDRIRAVRRYNNADEYVRLVLRLAEMYEEGGVEIVESVPEPAGPPLTVDRPDGIASSPSLPDAPSASRSSAIPTTPQTGGMPSRNGGGTPSTTPRQSSAPASPNGAPDEPSSAPKTGEDETRQPSESNTADRTPEPSSAPSSEPSVPDSTPSPGPSITDSGEPGDGLTTSPSSPPSVSEPDAASSAAVGWAPAMREVVLAILGES
jgi:hypothetical protein